MRRAGAAQVRSRGEEPYREQPECEDERRHRERNDASHSALPEPVVALHEGERCAHSEDRDDREAVPREHEEEDDGERIGQEEEPEQPGAPPPEGELSKTEFSLHDRPDTEESLI